MTNLIKWNWECTSPDEEWTLFYRGNPIATFYSPEIAQAFYELVLTAHVLNYEAPVIGCSRAEGNLRRILLILDREIEKGAGFPAP